MYVNSQFVISVNYTNQQGFCNITKTFNINYDMLTVELNLKILHHITFKKNSTTISQREDNIFHRM
jgi:hypothetical protein